MEAILDGYLRPLGREAPALAIGQPDLGLVPVPRETAARIRVQVEVDGKGHVDGEAKGAPDRAELVETREPVSMRGKDQLAPVDQAELPAIAVMMRLQLNATVWKIPDSHANTIGKADGSRAHQRLEKVVQDQSGGGFAAETQRVV